jgi:hypothetical protein
MADPIEIQPGERETLISAGDVQEFFADVRSDVELFLSETFTGSGERAAPDDRGKIGASRGTEVIAYCPQTASSPARVELSPTGKRVSLGTDGFYFDRQTRVKYDVFQESASSLTDVSADQTANLASGASQTTTIGADAGEVWTVSAMKLFAVQEGNWSSGQHSFEVQTEGTTIELAYGQAEYNEPLEFASGQWAQANLTARRDIIGSRIDADEGLDVVYRNNADDTRLKDREIRFRFEVTQIG